MKLWIIVGVLLSIIVGGAYLYVTSSQAKIEQLVSDNSTLKSNVQILMESNEKNVKVIDDLQKSFVEVRENYDRIETEFQAIRSQKSLLTEKFEKSDLGALAAARPGLVEKIINNASGKAMRCFEILSGAPLTQKERNASNAEEFNSECPFLWGS